MFIGRLYSAPLVGVEQNENMSLWTSAAKLIRLADLECDELSSNICDAARIPKFSATVEGHKL